MGGGYGSWMSVKGEVWVMGVRERDWGERK